MSTTKKSAFPKFVENTETVNFGEVEVPITQVKDYQRSLFDFTKSLRQAKQMLRPKEELSRVADESIFQYAERKNYTDAAILSLTLRAFKDVLDDETYSQNIFPLTAKLHELTTSSNLEERDAIIVECFNILTDLVPLLEPETIVAFEAAFIDRIHNDTIRVGGGKRKSRRRLGKSRRRLGKSRRRLGKSRRRLGKSRRRV